MVKNKKNCKLRILVSLLLRVIPIGLNPNLVLNTNEVEELIADGPFLTIYGGFKTSI